MFGEYVSATTFQIDKRDDNEDIIVQCVQKMHKMDGNNLRKTNYIIEQIFTQHSIINL